MPKLARVLNAPFKMAGVPVDVYRKPSTMQKDPFGRELTTDYILAASNVLTLISSETPKPSLDRDKSGNSEPIYKNFYFRLSEFQPQIGDRWTSHSNNWEVYKMLSEPAAGLVEVFCFSTGAAQ